MKRIFFSVIINNMTRLIVKLKMKARELGKMVTAVYYAGRNPELPGFTRFLIIFTTAYALSPIDLIPDFIPVLGYIDDLIILPALITLCIKRIPDGIMEESLRLAEEQPLSLKKNWKAGAVILLIWGSVIFKVVLAVIK